MNDIDEKNELKIIKNFIYNDDVQNKILDIKNSVKEFNIFEITGMQNQEIKHSNTLAWLLGSKEHGLGDKVFIEFLKLTLRTTVNNREYFNNLDIDVEELKKYIYLSIRKKDLEIRREYNNIDILVVDNNNKFVFVIENKVDSSESKNQLYKYYKRVSNSFYGYKSYFIFLTKDLSEPNEKYKNGKLNRKRYLLCSYNEIMQILNMILSLNKKGNSYIKKETEFILENYKDLLVRRNIVEHERLSNLCKDIWTNPYYREALNILVNNKPNIISVSLDKILNEDKDLIRVDKTGTTRRVIIHRNFDNHPIIKELHSHVDSKENSGVWKNRAIIFRIYIENDRLEWNLMLESSTNKNQQLISEFLQTIEEVTGIKKGNKFSLTGKVVLCKFENLDDIDNIESEIKKSLLKIKGLANSIIEVLNKKF